MSGEIINRVANSALITIDLTDYAPKETIAILDIKDFLFEGIILKEKEFRNTLKEFDFSVYTDKIVALYCSSDAIVPMWAFMLLTSYLITLLPKFILAKKKTSFRKYSLIILMQLTLLNLKIKK